MLFLYGSCPYHARAFYPYFAEIRKMFWFEYAEIRKMFWCEYAEIRKMFDRIRREKS